MDNRIGYGLLFSEALEKALESFERVGKIVQFSFTTDDHRVTWAELRDDGWRVYASHSSNRRMIEDD